MLLFLVLGCGGNDPPPSVDAPVTPAADGPVASADAPPGTPDATPGTPDARPGTPDADPAAPDAAPGMCGAVGDSCTTSCPDGLVCRTGAGGGICVPDREGCGGFAGAVCPPEAPTCLYLEGADFGVCLTAAEADCVCTRSPGAVSDC